MRPLLAALALALALACLATSAGAATARPDLLLEPFAYLAGHCWKGTFDDGKRTDEHCFAWLYDGRMLRDTHTVRAPGQPDAVGESTYFVNSVTKRVEYLYIESEGGFSRGSVEASQDALSFPDAQYVSEGEVLVYRSRWTPRGDDAYEAWSEAQGRSGWSTLFKMVMTRTR